MNQVTFRNLGGKHIPLQPWPQVFYVSRRVLEVADHIEVRPLTVTGLLKGIVCNFVTMNWWRLAGLLRRSRP